MSTNTIENNSTRSLLDDAFAVHADKKPSGAVDGIARQKGENLLFETRTQHRGSAPCYRSLVTEPMTAIVQFKWSLKRP